MKNIEIYKILKKVMEDRDLSVANIAKICDLPDSTVRGIIKRKQNTVALDVAFKLADGLNVSLEYLNGLATENQKNATTPSENDYLEKFQFIEKHSPEGAKTLQYILERELAIAKHLVELKKKTYKDSYILELPTENADQPTRTLNYYQRLASAGTGQIVFDDVPVDLIEIPDIPEYNRVKYAIGVNGDSMEPLYYDGDILLVEPMLDVRIDDIGIFIVDGESLVKKRGKKSLISLNKKKNYPEIPFTEETRCLGRVVDKISTPDSAYTKLEAEDISALERGRDLLWAQALGIDKKESKNSGAKESTDKSKTVSHPDISALDPKDLAALERGKIKMFKPEKNA